MLKGLELVKWAAVEHAYGPASDTPIYIRALASAAEAQRAAAYEELFASLVHQGTVYEASVHALPFLVELLANLDMPQRDMLAMLVASILAGRGYCEVHFASGRVNPFTGKPLDPSFDIDAKLAREKTVVAAIRSHGAQAVPLLLSFLDHQSADLRQEVARALAVYPELSSATSPRLREALAVESDSYARDTIRAALRELEGSPG